MAVRPGITTAQAQQLRDSGWTIPQIQQHYTIGGTLNGTMAPPGALNGTPVSFQSIPQTQPGQVPLSPMIQGPGSGAAGIDMTTGQPLAAGLPAAAGGILAALGLGALVAPAAAAYGISQAIGVQYPWETGPGEGFIAPWSRDIVQDEGGRWVTRETRPDLFNGGAAVATVPQGGLPGVMGVQVVKTWTANGWPFAMTSDGRIHTVTKSGIRKSWKPYKSIVLGKKMNQGMALRAVRKLQGIRKLADKIEKLGGTRTVYRKRKK